MTLYIKIPTPTIQAGTGIKYIKIFSLGKLIIKKLIIAHIEVLAPKWIANYCLLIFYETINIAPNKAPNTYNCNKIFDPNLISTVFPKKYNPTILKTIL